jgi:hypothetical protein
VGRTTQPQSRTKRLSTLRRRIHNKRRRRLARELRYVCGTENEAYKSSADMEDSQGNPLEVSPANPEVSKPRGETEGGAENAGQGERERTSGAGSPKKAGKP